MKPVFAIIVTYRRFEQFKQTFESLLPTLPEGSKLVIAHNPGVNNELEADQYKLFYQQITTAPSAVSVYVHYLRRNNGWGAAMNETLFFYPDWKEYEYLLESNNDVTYDPVWCEQSQLRMEKHSSIGILGLWAHPHHGVRAQLSDIRIKDNMPATAWFFRTKDLETFLPFKEKGACKTRGGNGEDSDMVVKVQAMGKWVCAPIPDLAHHMDGYDENLGKQNKAYL